MVRLSEVMTTNLKFIEAQSSVYEAIEQMVDHRIRSLLVRISEERSEYGVIAARDIVVKVMSKGIDPADVKVGDIATTPMLCTDENATMHEAAQIMVDNNVARVFVCGNGRPVGVVSFIDLMSGALIARARGDHAA
jgi:signal-transduction protein with cAMP-binding, CBS, and nucleotidyltransferase domain